MDENLAYYVGFSHFIGIGPMRFSALVKHFNSVKRAYLADKKSLTEVIGTNWAEKFVRFRSLFDPVKKLDELKKKNIKVLPLWHKSLQNYFGNKTLLNRSGGSIPAAEILQRLYKKPIILTGFTLPDDNIHSPNENFDEEMFWKGIEALKLIYSL